MRSKVASEAARSLHGRLADMSPAERVALAARLADQGIVSYMATQGIDRATAIARIKATRRLGRRHSASAAADER